MLEPKIVARMIQALKLAPLDKVLEVGTGSGYATALLGKMAAEVITVDIDAEQQARAKTVLDNLGYKNITYQVADGLAAEIGGGLFDAIYIGGATNNIPEQLKNQLHEKGGHMVVVVGDAPVQRALLIVRDGNSFTETTLFDTLIPKLSSKADAPATSFTF